MKFQDRLAFLSSSKRRRVLTLLDEQSAPAGELAQRGSISRPTAHQALTQCLNWKWVTTDYKGPTDKKDPETKSGTPQYALTTAGQLIIETWPLLGEQTTTDQSQNQGQDSKADSNESLTSEMMDYFVGSTEREKLLATLRERPRTNSELVADSRLSIGQSMISQTLSTLLESEWIEWSNEDESYMLTPTGKGVLGRYERLKETVCWVTAHAREINSLGEIGATLPARSVAQNRDRVEVIETTASNPDMVLNHYADRVAECEPEQIRGIVPMVSTLSNQIHRPLLERGVAMEIVITESAYKAAQSAYPRMLKSAVTSELFDLYVYPRQLTFAVAILEDCQRAIVSGQGDMGVAKVCFDSPVEALIDWARALFQNYRSAATSVQQLP